MITFFIPADYASIEELKDASIFDAVSVSRIDNVDVFGYVDGIPYAAVYTDENAVFDEDGYELSPAITWCTAGDAML